MNVSIFMRLPNCRIHRDCLQIDLGLTLSTSLQDGKLEYVVSVYIDLLK